MSAVLTPQQLVTNNILGTTTNVANQSANVYKNIYNQIWNPPATYTTAEIITAMGTNAASILGALTTISTFITSLGGTVPTLTGAQAYTANTDGTVTLTPAS